MVFKRMKSVNQNASISVVRRVNTFSCGICWDKNHIEIYIVRLYNQRLHKKLHKIFYSSSFGLILIKVVKSVRCKHCDAIIMKLTWQPVAIVSLVTNDTVIESVLSVTWDPFLTELVTQVDGWNNKIKALLYFTVKITENI